MMWWPGGGWWWVGFGMFWMVIFWGAIIALIVWAVRKITERGGSAQKRDPLDIAKERYARGEISREEFEQIKKNLA